MSIHVSKGCPRLTFTDDILKCIFLKAGCISFIHTFYPWAFQANGVLLPASVLPSVRLVRTITHHRFELESPNLPHGILSVGIGNGGHWPWPSRSFWPFWLRILGNFACLHDNLYWIWARITKFPWNVYLGILSAVIENGGHWRWPSRSFRHKKRHSTSLLYTDLGRPRGVTRPKRVLVKTCDGLGHFLWNK